MRPTNFLWLPFVLILISPLIVDAQSKEPYFPVPKELPGNYEGKWYGMHIPTSLVSNEEYVGFFRGEGFPNQTIISSWGYKAKPIEEIKDLLTETWYDICTHPEQWGDIRINEVAFVPLDQFPGRYQKLRKEATERNKGKTRISESGYIADYVNGFPFPGSKNGEEIAWNFVNAQNFGDMMFSNFYAAIVDRKGQTRYIVADQNFMSWVGRLQGKQVPRWEPNQNNYKWFNSIPYKLPGDLRGILTITHRYDSVKQDDMWIYLPSLRRVRRMATSQRWDKLPGGYDVTYDSIVGFQGKVNNYDWKYLGRKVLLCGRTAKDELQEIKGKPGGGCADQLYQRVNTIVLEYIPKITSVISKAVIYIDPDTYVCYYADFFDKRGRKYLFLNYCWAVSKDGCMSLQGYLAADVQRTHSSNTYVFRTLFNEDAEKHIGLSPSYFTMGFLRKRYGGR